ncbi:MAG: sugar phosphate isomerase/epimerase, partial [Anaerolineales bacterium]
MMISSIWTGLYAELPLPQALETLYTQGWTAFEMSTEHFVQIANAEDPTKAIEETLACLERLDITMPQGHAYLQARVADLDAEQRETDIAILEQHLEIAARLGLKVVVMHPGGRQGYTTRDDCQRIQALNSQAFRRLGDYAGAHNLLIGLENLKRRGAETPDDLWNLLDAIDHPALGITLDTSH